MKYFELSRQVNVFVLTMINGDDDNRFNLDFMNELNALLDEVENAKGNISLVMTSSHPKTWSTGINLDWFLSTTGEDFTAFAKSLDKTFVRIATLDLPTLACITGNVYAGAAIMSCGFDFRFMREDRGRFCFPEVDIKIPFTEPMHEVIDLLPDKQVLKELALTGRAMGGEECFEKKVVDAIYSAEVLQEKSLEYAAMLAEKDRATYAHIKNGLRKKLVNRKELLNV